MATVLALVLLAEYRGVTKHSHDTDTGMGILCAPASKTSEDNDSTTTARPWTKLAPDMHHQAQIRRVLAS